MKHFKQLTFNTLAISFFLLTSPAICNKKTCYFMKKTDVLQSSIEISGFVTVEIYIVDDNKIVLLNDMVEKNLYLFSEANGAWSSTQRKLPLHTPVSIIMEQSQLRLCIIGYENTLDKKRKRTVVSIYNINDAILNLEKPEVVISIPSDKVFASERRKKGEQLFSFPGEPGHCLLVGQCTEAKWDPLSVIGSIISGGHGGYARWPFIAEITDNNIRSYYKWPEGLWTNEVVSTTGISLLNNKCHLVGIKSKEYMSSLRSIEYSCFDVELKKWNKPATLYKEKRNGEQRDANVGLPEILAVEGRTFVTWSLINDTLLGSGIFIRTKIDDKWGDIVKISSSGDYPLLVEQEKIVYVFWREENKGFVYSTNESGFWSKPLDAFKAEDIATGYRMPWAITADDYGSFHIVYSQKCPSKGYRIKDLIYVKLTKE